MVLGWCVALEAAQRAPFNPESLVQGFRVGGGIWEFSLMLSTGQFITLPVSHKQFLSMSYKVMMVTMALGANDFCCHQVLVKYPA